MAIRRFTFAFTEQFLHCGWMQQVRMHRLHARCGCGRCTNPMTCSQQYTRST
jgi:hypothetical protein